PCAFRWLKQCPRRRRPRPAWRLSLVDAERDAFRQLLAALEEQRARCAVLGEDTAVGAKNTGSRSTKRAAICSGIANVERPPDGAIKVRRMASPRLSWFSATCATSVAETA